MKRRRTGSLFMGLAAAAAGILVFALPAAASSTGPIRNAEYFEL